MGHNIFQGSAAAPYHLSAGVVAVNQDGLVGVHHFAELSGHQDVYALVRETVEANESLEVTARRGLREEFGAEAKIVGYLGSRVTTFIIDHVEIRKSTEYLLAEVVSWDEARRKSDDDTIGSRIEWHSPSDLVGILRAQRLRLGDPDIDEVEVLDRYQNR
jgi:ADP-ribose pyrophosphatase YjhB (NUDIX family)